MLHNLMYRIAQNFGEVKLCGKSIARKNAGEFTIANISNFSESGI